MKFLDRLKTTLETWRLSKRSASDIHFTRTLSHTEVEEIEAYVNGKKYMSRYPVAKKAKVADSTGRIS
jgi:hypothetical protein